MLFIMYRILVLTVQQLLKRKKMGTYTFKRGACETQTINITAQRRDDPISILGASERVFEALNEIEGHRVTHVGATDYTDMVYRNQYSCKY